MLVKQVVFETGVVENNAFYTAKQYLLLWHFISLKKK